MRSTGTDQPVRAMKAGNAAGAKGLGRAVVFNVQLATGGDLGGNEAIRHPEAVGGEGLSGGESQRRGGGGGRGEPSRPREKARGGEPLALEARGRGQPRARAGAERGHSGRD